MTREEKIQELEKELKDLKSQNKKGLPWTDISRKIAESINESIAHRQKETQVKSAISCIIAKAYDSCNVQYLSEEECEEAMPLVNEILDFIKLKRASKVM